MRWRLWVAASILLLVISSLPALASESSRYVRLKYAEGEVTISPSDKQRPTDATMNTPVLDGDQILTGNGRAELTFRNGIIVRVGDNSTVQLESAYSPMIIDLLEGTLFVDSHLVNSFGDELEVRAGDAQVYLINEGNMRVDLGTHGGVRVTNIEGESEVRAQGSRVLLERGERTYVDPGNAPERPEQMSQNFDDLDDWNQSRMDLYARNDSGNNYGSNGRDEYMNSDLYYDTQDLDQYGDWQNYGQYGQVWVPNQASDWRPYYDGRWEYANDSWFWVSYEPWGWAPYHYGRWGFGVGIGWYWVPGYVFAPSWVSFYDYGDYFGWAPLDYYDHPCGGYWGDHGYYGGYGNNIQKQKTGPSAWTFVKKNDLGAKDIRNISVPKGEIGRIPLDEKRVVRNPRIEVASYVIPKTQISPGFVNDKRIIRKSPDINNPVGLTHREDAFGHSSDQKTNQGKPNAVPLPKQHETDWDKAQPKNNTHPVPPAPKGNEAKPIPKGAPNKISRDWDTERSAPPKNNPHYQGYGNFESSNRNSGNRDEQFDRGTTRVKPFSPYVSPYNSGRNYGDHNQRNNNGPWFQEPKQFRDDDLDQREISPRYYDEARKIFERFDRENADNDHNTNTGNNRNYKSVDPKSTPKENYHIDNPKTGSHPPSSSTNSNHGSSGSSSKPAQSSKPPKQKH